MERTLFEPEHESFRDTVRTFLEKEVVPHHEEWEREGIVPREVWTKAGELGLLGFMMPEEFGGGGVSDFRYNVVLQEELTRVGASGVGFALHTDLVSGYLLSYTNDEQRQRWFPKFVSGEMITAIAMTEPGTGSDLQGIRTTAVREGDHYVVNGAKTFITNGINADFVIVACKTDPDAGAMGVSLIVLERGMEGFERGRNLDKLGLKAQDTAELFFDNVRVPVENLLGEEGRGFVYLMEKLPQERLTISVVAAAACRQVIDMTLEYVKSRKAFGKPIGSFQNTRFVLAELETEQRIAQVFVDRSVEALNDGKLSIDDAAAGKWWTTELQKRTVDSCLQLHGGYGYMSEYPISKAYRDTRIQTIYGGTTEIMKEIVGRSLGI
ncbi:acyl-CoA dehydrogenase family protein [Aeromicrobium tamlense]|uniref:Acyl-CoA dehydrogenase family protein n=1 Tax=Aeromicrobium tamlense TaxID=375541 RepID=A0A8I0KIE9_9ACTN|nr:acyl-CoA dehydrogenase family protein [Aeromicrobium tamlense]MBD1269842.1 acyl-CoA dehydrogenase family protein [Aeromicrobium tamlense]NYI39501.1 alkylation response protein AidB-like acyl-CoA dehydrogenase [Aeromicrobium tamlense]